LRLRRDWVSITFEAAFLKLDLRSVPFAFDFLTDNGFSWSILAFLLLLAPSSVSAVARLLGGLAGLEADFGCSTSGSFIRLRCDSPFSAKLGKLRSELFLLLDESKETSSGAPSGSIDDIR
jgi:hypothetical protein